MLWSDWYDDPEWIRKEERRVRVLPFPRGIRGDFEGSRSLGNPETRNYGLRQRIGGNVEEAGEVEGGVEHGGNEKHGDGDEESDGERSNRVFSSRLKRRKR